METKIYRVDRENVTPQALEEPAQILREGGLIAFPTETVYGLGGDACNARSSEKIYAAKGRPSDNPLIVHIADISQLEEIASVVPEEAYKLSEAFWPGPLTMIVDKNAVIPHETTGGLDTVAVRMPSHPVARQLILTSGCMIAAPSANTSGRPSPTTARHVWDDLHGRIDGIIDGGPVDIGLESSIIDLSEGIPTILRPGYINLEMFEDVLGRGNVRIDPGIQSENKRVRPKAPGMRYKHYAPKGDLTIVEGPSDRAILRINALASQAVQEGRRVGIIATDETRDRYTSGEVVTIGARSDEYSIARHLFAVLRKFDDDQIEVIYSESFDTPKIGMAIMNRLLKAAAHRVIEA